MWKKYWAKFVGLLALVSLDLFGLFGIGMFTKLKTVFLPCLLVGSIHVVVTLWQDKKRSWAVPLGLAVVLLQILLFLHFGIPTKLRTLIFAGAMLGCIYGLIALGYSLIYKASGLMSFVQGDIMTIGAYVGLTFYGILKFPFWLSFLCTALIAFLFGMLLERGVIRKLLSKNVMAIYVVLATIAISYIIQNGAQFIWGTVPRSFPSLFSTISVRFLGIKVQPEAIMCVVVSLVCMVILHIFMTKTRIGTSMRAAAMDPKAAEACGIDVSLNTGLTWGFSAGLAAVAGMLIGPIYGVTTMLGAFIGRKGFAGAVIGGYGNMYGSIIGGIILGLAETLVAGYASSTLKNLFAYILLILFLFIRPTGLFNERAIHDV